MSEVLSYIAALAATALGFFEPFNKKMSVILVFSFVANLLVGISYILVGGTSGALICVIAGIQLLINFIFNVKGKKVPVWLIIIYSLAYSTVNILTFAKWYDIFSLGAALSLVFSMAQSNPKHYRVLLILNMGSWLAYDVLAHAYGNMLMHLSSIITILIAIYVNDIRKKKQEL